MGKKLTNCKGERKKKSSFKVCPKTELKRVWGGEKETRSTPGGSSKGASICGTLAQSPSRLKSRDRQRACLEKSRQGARKLGWQRTLEPGCSGRKCLLGSCSHCPVVWLPRAGWRARCASGFSPPPSPIPFSPRLLQSAELSRPKLHHLAKKKEKRKSRVRAGRPGLALGFGRWQQPRHPPPLRSAALRSRGPTVWQLTFAWFFHTQPARPLLQPSAQQPLLPQPRTPESAEGRLPLLSPTSPRAHGDRKAMPPAGKWPPKEPC